jgi:hypothetical protein
MNPQNEETEGPRIGAVIVEELKRLGFALQWNGSFAERIHIPVIDWKRR